MTDQPCLCQSPRYAPGLTTQEREPCDECVAEMGIERHERTDENMALLAELLERQERMAAE